jgi:hypothetical protein
LPPTEPLGQSLPRSRTNRGTGERLSTAEGTDVSLKPKDNYLRCYEVVPALSYGLDGYFSLSNDEQPHTSVDYPALAEACRGCPAPESWAESGGGLFFAPPSRRPSEGTAAAKIPTLRPGRPNAIWQSDFLPNGS